MTATRQYPDPMKVPYTYIEDLDEAIAALEEMRGADKVAVDTETEAVPGSSLDRDGPGAWVVLSAAARYADGTEKVWVINTSNFPHGALADAMAGQHFYCWNANFEQEVFDRAGCDTAWLEDLMLYQAILDQGLAIDGRQFYTGLAAEAYNLLGVDMEGKGTLQLSYKAAEELTDDQKAYAAQDAIVTLWLQPILDDRVDEAGLREIATLESRARPFIDAMRRRGMWVDKDGWRSVLAEHQDAKAQVTTRLANLTGGGQGNLFSAVVEPNWKVGSVEDRKKVLNQFAPERVRAYTATLDGEDGEGRLLLPGDSLDDDALKLIGGDIAEALMDWSKHEKILSTYGEALLALAHDDGRFHSKYMQAIVDTGRLSSEKPNAQNQSPEMKPYLRPTPGLPAVQTLTLDEVLAIGPRRLRVYVYADLSQAELRVLAQESADEVLRTSYLNNADIHITTAGAMYNTDMEALAEEDPDSYKSMRAKGKTLNFGVCYGLGAASLSKQLSVEGIPTTKDEGKELLRLYGEAYPGVTEWLAKRDAYIQDLASNPPDCNFSATMRLHKLWKPVKTAFHAAKNSLGYLPSVEEIAEQYRPTHTVEAQLARSLGRTPTAGEIEAAVAERDAEVAWVRSFRAPVVLLADGVTPLTWESRTRAGRRRQFNVTTKDWILEQVMVICKSNKELPIRIRDAWAEEHNVVLTVAGRNGKPRSLPPQKIRKIFDGKYGPDRQESLVETVLTQMPEAANYLAREALGGAIRAKGNQYRNAPIQGGVADAVLRAYGQLWERLARFDGAFPVQSVHDSIIIECYLEDALEVGEVLRTSMEDSLAHDVPDVPVKADMQILGSADDKEDDIPTEWVTETLAALYPDGVPEASNVQPTSAA